MKSALLAAFVILLPGPWLWAEDANFPRLTLDELRTKYADDNSRFLVIDGVTVHYKDEGVGPAILMVHGSRSTLKTWDHVAAVLSSRYRVIRFDVPPHGLSGPVSDQAAQDLQPTDIPEQLLATLGVKRITYVGVSSGGTLGVYLAAKRPDLVSRLILSNTPSDPVDTSHLVLSDDFLEAQRVARETGFESPQFWNLFLDYFSGDPNRIGNGIRTQYYDFNRRISEKNDRALVGTVQNHEKATAAMSQVVAPTLLIWGAQDRLLVPAAAHTLAGYLTNAQVSLMFMPDVGHYPPLETPVRFGRLIDAYIQAAVITSDATTD
ncbi:MAG: alpha/beta fold hydrolase [Lysobacterales bacterium]